MSVSTLTPMRHHAPLFSLLLLIHAINKTHFWVINSQSAFWSISFVIQSPPPAQCTADITSLEHIWTLSYLILLNRGTRHTSNHSNAPQGGKVERKACGVKDDDVVEFKYIYFSPYLHCMCNLKLIKH